MGCCVSLKGSEGAVEYEKTQWRYSIGNRKRRGSSHGHSGDGYVGGGCDGGDGGGDGGCGGGGGGGDGGDGGGGGAIAAQDVTVNPIPGNGTTSEVPTPTISIPTLTSTVITTTEIATITTVIQTTVTTEVPTVVTTRVPATFSPTPTGAASQHGPAKALIAIGGIAALAQLL
ncbi:hypothetical protein BGW42_004890 [Actinomortierella wolfii]|nr:hypothetical protein BGW42_004890 [Actinomortierella wolfii]